MSVGIPLFVVDHVMGKAFTAPELIIAHCFGWAIGMHKWQMPEGGGMAARGWARMLVGHAESSVPMEHSERRRSKAGKYRNSHPI